MVGSEVDGGVRGRFPPSFKGVDVEPVNTQRGPPLGRLSHDWIEWEMYFQFTAQRRDLETHVTDLTLYFSDGCWKVELLNTYLT